ncbi:MAG: hypothetical protein ACI4AK_07485 [Lepagella sp.]
MEVLFLTTDFTDLPDFCYASVGTRWVGWEDALSGKSVVIPLGFVKNRVIIPLGFVKNRVVIPLGFVKNRVVIPLGFVIFLLFLLVILQKMTILAVVFLLS